jgi:hypothetical protein
VEAARAVPFSQLKNRPARAQQMQGSSTRLLSVLHSIGNGGALAGTAIRRGPVCHLCETVMTAGPTGAEHCCCRISYSGFPNRTPEVRGAHEVSTRRRRKCIATGGSRCLAPYPRGSSPQRRFKSLSTRWISLPCRTSASPDCVLLFCWSAPGGSARRSARASGARRSGRRRSGFHQLLVTEPLRRPRWCRHCRDRGDRCQSLGC